MHLRNGGSSALSSLFLCRGSTMSISRRDFVAASASLLAISLAARAGLPQSAPPPDASPGAPPATPAARALSLQIGQPAWTELHRRLVTVNEDIRTRGLRTIDGVEGTLLTGYPYTEFYDWDLYFENLYLS